MIEPLTFHQKKHFDESDRTLFCMSHKLSDVWRLVEKYRLATVGNITEQ